MNRRVPAFVGVGVAGFAVQMAVLTGFIAISCPYPAATLLAVEAAVLHNFVWHERWTWRDRAAHSTLWSRLVRFHAGTAITSLIGNVVGTVFGVEVIGLHPAVASLASVLLTSVVNFTLADRWVFTRRSIPAALLLLLTAGSAAAASPEPETLSAWNAYVQNTERTFDRHHNDPPVVDPEGHTVTVPGGTIHEWRGSVVVRNTTVTALVDALSNPGLPPPSEDVLEARVLGRHDGKLSVYLKLTRSAIVTVVYDTEHDVVFERRSASFATSRSVSTKINETGGGDRGFLWRLNSYWRYRQVGDDVRVDVLSLSLSRSVPRVVRPVAGPLINRVARESMVRTLAALERFAAALRPEQAQ
jgi:putative flippase GtrA